MTEAANDEPPKFKTKGKLIKHKGHWFPVVSFPNEQQFEAIRKFPLDDRDILVACYQKSGCILAILLHFALGIAKRNASL